MLVSWRISCGYKETSMKAKIFREVFPQRQLKKKKKLYRTGQGCLSRWLCWLLICNFISHVVLCKSTLYSPEVIVFLEAYWWIDSPFLVLSELWVNGHLSCSVSDSSPSWLIHSWFSHLLTELFYLASN